MLENDSSQNENKSFVKPFINKLNLLSKNSIIALVVISLIGLSIRLYYLPYNLPITLDGLGYFLYAIDLSILGKYPTTYTFPNNGWPTFLSVFFYFFHSENFLDYMNLQRLLSVIISTLTIIPTYLLCRRFFKNYYAMVGAAIIAFEPRLVQHSLLGLPESLFILLGTTALFLFLSKSYKIIYAAFAVAALFALIRYEGILLMIPFSFIFFLRFRKERNVMLKYLLTISIFLIILLPMMHIRTQTIGYDELVSNVVAGPRYYQTISQQSENSYNMLFNSIEVGFVNLVKYLGWIMIPSFLVFVPYGAIMIFKNRDYKNITIILTVIVFILPAFYAYSRDIQETKYLYVLFPMFCILSCFTVEKLNKKINKPNMLVGILFSGIILSSLVFLDFKKIDYEHEQESFDIAKSVYSLTKVTNDHHPESKYVRVIGMMKKFPILSTEVSFEPKLVSTDSNSLIEFIQKNREAGLDHIIVDGMPTRAKFINEIFADDSKFPYLIKEFDSKDHGFNYHVKIFKINYDIFDSLSNNKK